MTAPNAIPVFIEAGAKRVFASALDWPGWARSGKSEELALAALADYLPRYQPIVALAQLAAADRLAGDHRAARGPREER